MIRPEKMTVKTQEALATAHEKAMTMSAGTIEPEHLLLALLEQEAGLVPELLKKIGAAPSQLRGSLEGSLKKLPKVTGSVQVSLSPALNRILEQALKEADAMRDSFVSTEHLLLALAGEKEAACARLLSQNGVTRENILSALKALRGDAAVTDWR